MITLYAFNNTPQRPDPSPFVIKVEMLLKMAGLPYRKAKGNMRQAPKGKLPYIEDNGQLIADSTLIRLHLADQYGISLDEGLGEADKALAWSVECLCSDHLYWCAVHQLWMDDATFARGPAQFFKVIPALIRPPIVALIRRKVRRNLDGQGLGRFTASERQRLQVLDVTSLAQLLGDKPYMLGDVPSWLDATVFAFIHRSLGEHLSGTPLQQAVQAHPNLVAYTQRLQQQYWPEWSES